MVGRMESSVAEPRVEIDWAAFLRRSDMVWETLPGDWDSAPFVGNGRLGAIFWAEGSVLRFELSRGDLYDHRRIGGAHTVLFSKCRLPVGAFELHFGGALPLTGELRLDLWQAEVRGRMAAEVAWEFRCFAAADRGLLVLELRAPTADAPRLEWHPREARSTRNPSQTPADYHPYPPPTREAVDGISLSVQEMPEDAEFRTEGQGAGEYATGWRLLEVGPGHWRCLISLGYSCPGRLAAEEAVAAIKSGLASPWDTLEAAHRQWWQSYYAKSFLSIPDAALESFYWIQIYKMGSASRRGGPILDLMGPWFRDTGWPAIWWNLNIQLTYWPFYMSNHLDEAEPLIETVWAGRHHLARNAAPYEADSLAIGRAASPDCESPVGTETGNLPWVLHNLWMHYRSSMDDVFLAERLFPLMKGSFRYLRHIAVERADGRLELPPTASPEYTDSVANCSYTLACFRWLTRTLVEAANRLGLDDPVVAECRDVLQRLVPYPVDQATGVMVGDGLPFTESHRHWSHLFMIYPFHEWDWNDPAQRPLVQQSLENWTSKADGFQGYSWLGAAAMWAAAGDGERALAYLHTFVQKSPLPNTLYREGSPVIETPLACARVIQELVLVSHGQVIRVFPAIPAAWADVEFADMRAEGGFLVSARRRAGVTRVVCITSLAGEPCRISTSIAGRVGARSSSPIAIREVGEGIIELELAKGQRVLLYPEESPVSVLEAPQPVVLREASEPWGGCEHRTSV